MILDKDGIAPELPEPTDDPFRTDCPPGEYVTDCANEFYFSCTYAQRALFREEIQFVRHVFETRLHPELLRMLTYLAGSRGGFPVNTGKYGRWLNRYLSAEEQGMLSSAYDLHSLEASQQALDTAMELFRRSLAEVCGALGCEDPGYHEIIMGYLRTLKDIRDEENPDKQEQII